VDYHLSHPFLQTVLPKLCTLVHDKVERVRLAVVDLLLKVKRLRAIKVVLLQLVDLYVVCNMINSVKVNNNLLVIFSVRWYCTPQKQFGSYTL